MANAPSYKRGPGAVATHGLSYKPIYRSWSSMMSRCYSPGTNSYELYGGRGITVCERWMSVENFVADMGGTYHPGLTLDRIDGSGNYEPGNCRWATQKEQQRNRRNNHLITYEGRTLCLAAWAEHFGVSVCTLWRRVKKLGAETAMRRSGNTPFGGTLEKTFHSGNEHHGTKVTDQSVSEIIDLLLVETPYTVMTAKYGISYGHIRSIATGRKRPGVRPEVPRPIGPRYLRAVAPQKGQVSSR